MSVDEEMSTGKEAVITIVLLHMVHVCLCESLVHCEVGEIIGTVSSSDFQRSGHI